MSKTGGYVPPKYNLTLSHSTQQRSHDLMDNSWIILAYSNPTGRRAKNTNHFGDLD